MSTVEGITLTRTRSRLAGRLVKEHGTAFRHEKHTEANGRINVLLACTCPGGHGVNRLAWRGWITTVDADITIGPIAVTPTAAPFTLAEIAALPIPEDLRPVVTYLRRSAITTLLDRIGTRVPALPVAA